MARETIKEVRVSLYKFLVFLLFLNCATKYTLLTEMVPFKKGFATYLSCKLMANKN